MHNRDVSTIGRISIGYRSVQISRVEAGPCVGHPCVENLDCFFVQERLPALVTGIGVSGDFNGRPLPALALIPHINRAPIPGRQYLHLSIGQWSGRVFCSIRPRTAAEFCPPGVVRRLAALSGISFGSDVLHVAGDAGEPLAVLAQRHGGRGLRGRGGEQLHLAALRGQLHIHAIRNQLDGLRLLRRLRFFFLFRRSGGLRGFGGRGGLLRRGLLRLHRHNTAVAGVFVLLRYGVFIGAGGLARNGFPLAHIRRCFIFLRLQHIVMGAIFNMDLRLSTAPAHQAGRLGQLFQLGVIDLDAGPHRVRVLGQHFGLGHAFDGEIVVGALPLAIRIQGLRLLHRRGVEALPLVAHALLAVGLHRKGHGVANLGFHHAGHLHDLDACRLLGGRWRPGGFRLLRGHRRLGGFRCFGGCRRFLRLRAGARLRRGAGLRGFGGRRAGAGLRLRAGVRLLGRFRLLGGCRLLGGFRLLGGHADRCPIARRQGCGSQNRCQQHRCQQSG